jgi:protein-disulfide isomerase
MSKRTPQTKQISAPAKSVNWLVIGGVVLVGVVSLVLLLILTLKPTPVLALPDYCQTYPDRCVSSGTEDAPVTILEVFDFGCPHCRDFHEGTWPLLEQSYVAQAQVNWVVFPYALSADRILRPRQLFALRNKTPTSPTPKPYSLASTQPTI